MVSIANPRRPLPPLATETNYQAQDFEYFEYFGSPLTGSKAILRLNLKNKTTIDLPSTDDELKRLMINLFDAFPRDAIDYLKKRWPNET